MLFYRGRQRVLDSNGNPVSGALANFFLTGTATRADTYQSDALDPLNAHTNPVEANSAGFLPPIYLSADIEYRCELTDSFGASLPDGIVDPVNISPLAGLDAEDIGAILYARTPAEIAALVTPTDYAYAPDPWRDVRRDGAISDGATNDATKIATAFTGASGRKVIFPAPNGTSYRLTTALATNGPVVAGGVGRYSSGIPKTWLQFSLTSGASTAQWDFSGATSYIELDNLYIAHINGINPSNTTTGIGLKIANAPYNRLRDLLVSGFDTGIKVSGQFFYGELNNVSCLDNYTTGFELTGSLLNGTPINGGQFSRTKTGDGIWLHDVGSHTVARSTYREGNAGHGARFEGFHTFGDDGPYSEANALEDVYIPNAYPHWTAHYAIRNGYFDAQQGAGKSRIRVTLTSVAVRECKFFNDATVPPLQLTDLRGFQPSVFEGNEYAGKYLTNLGAAEQASSWIVDSKHPLVYFSSGAPTDGNAHIGSLWLNLNAATKQILGWRCVVPGRNGTPPAITTTGTTSIGSKVVTINVSNNSELVTGEYIRIAGVTFATGDAYAMICECLSNGTIVLDKAADQAVAAAAISYNTAELQPIPANNDVITSYNVPCTTAVAVQCLQFALATTEKATVTIDGVMASTAADDLATTKISKVLFSNNAGSITATAATDVGATNAAGGAVAYTVTGGSSGNNARIFVTQSTGSTRVFGFRATVVISKATPSIT